MSEFYSRFYLWKVFMTSRPPCVYVLFVAVKITNMFSNRDTSDEKPLLCQQSFRNFHKKNDKMCLGNLQNIPYWCGVLVFTLQNRTFFFLKHKNLVYQLPSSFATFIIAMDTNHFLFKSRVRHFELLTSSVWVHSFLLREKNVNFWSRIAVGLCYRFMKHDIW